MQLELFPELFGYDTDFEDDDGYIIVLQEDYLPPLIIKKPQ